MNNFEVAAQKRMKKLVIVPAYNEEKNIGRVVESLKSCDVELDVVVINDGSWDRTETQARRKGVTVISLPFNVGIGGAVQTGFMYAYEYGYDIALQFDGDGQHISSEIPLLLNPIIEEQCDVVIGSRFLRQRGYKVTFSRKLGIAIFSFINSLITGQKITDNTSGFRAYNKAAIAFLSQNYPSDYPEPEAIIILTRNNFRILEVPVRMRKRQSGRSSISALRSIYYMIKVVLAIIVGIFRGKERKSIHES